jgi:hypothetical protein
MSAKLKDFTDQQLIHEMVNRGYSIGADFPKSMMDRLKPPPPPPDTDEWRGGVILKDKIGAKRWALEIVLTAMIIATILIALVW